MDRREFLKFMGVASTATLATSCGVEKGTEKLIPFVVPPDENYIPGEDYYYNSTCTECPAQCGLSVKVREFKPIKLEGLKKHPINDGALCVRGQYSIVRLYHPDRIKSPLMKDGNGNFQAVSWDKAFEKISSKLQESQSKNLKNLYLSGRTTGSLNELINSFCNRMKVERLPEYETVSYANLKEANNILFGVKDIPSFQIENSDYLITLGADIFETFISPVNYTTQINRAKKNKDFAWLHIEPNVSLTGLQAKERVIIKPGSEPHFLVFLLNYIFNNNLQKNKVSSKILGQLPKISTNEIAESTGINPNKLNLIAQKLGQASKPLIIAGGVSVNQANGLETAMLTGLLQWALGMTNNLVDFDYSENYPEVGSLLDLKKLDDQLNNNSVGVLFISKTDPLTSLPKEINLDENIDKASFKVALSDFKTATAEKCDMILPLSHSLESWGDANPRRGIVNIIQPMLQPIFDSHSEGDILLNLMNEQTTYQEWLYSHWNTKYGSDFANNVVETGYNKISEKKISIRIRDTQTADFIRNAQFNTPLSMPALYAVPSIRTFDGRSSVIQLSSEIPDPLTTITYGEWVSISKHNAESMHIKDRDELQISFNGQSFNLPTKIQPGLQKDVFNVHIDKIDSKIFAIDSRSGEVIRTIDQLSFSKTGKSIMFPILAGSTDQENREIIPGHQDEKEMDQHHHTLYSLYPENEYPEYRWSMAIDLESCTGCSACVAACYIENNVAIAGPEEHLNGREMSWIRVQPYYNEHEEAEFLIMLCQQCGNAPCEPVCPVFATYHNPEGLNAMVYNRCVGTRYCHNNCPYKVRRFNWFEHKRKSPMDQMLNPDVFVRGKGVMEKCTFCVQRIRKAKDTAKDEDRKVFDGEVTPACAQTCPTEAIVFGNILDHDSEVYKRSRDDRKFRVLESIGTDSAVHYLRKKES